ncbi:GntR family transcriptional regulator [Pseudoxanthobacter sp.]|uniref:GntR family transcriptional regulator n=1 Tax=Pseudoxanthobacter sp. TaxID=1925742 RepID=UPI002FE3B0C4
MTETDGTGAATAPEWRPAACSATPLYLQVASHLESRINSGDFPVGSLLPTENELAGELGVSRQTVRQAIATLRTQGRLSARKGVGTRVESAANRPRQRLIAQSRSELFEFAKETEFVITEREEIAARGRLATELGCRPGRPFLRLAGARFPAGETQPFSWNEVYVDARLAAAVRDVGTLRTALFYLIEKVSGEKIQEIVQEIRPATLDAAMAARLSAREGDLALRVSRRYFGSGSRLLEYAIQILPADRFTYTSTLHPEA